MNTLESLAAEIVAKVHQSPDSRINLETTVAHMIREWYWKANESRLRENFKANIKKHDEQMAEMMAQINSH